jgi:hypothetical protein
VGKTNLSKEIEFFFFFLEREGGMLSMLKEGDEIGSQPKMK